MSTRVLAFVVTTCCSLVTGNLLEEVTEVTCKGQRSGGIWENITDNYKEEIPKGNGLFLCSFQQTSSDNIHINITVAGTYSIIEGRGETHWLLSQPDGSPNCNWLNRTKISLPFDLYPEQRLLLIGTSFNKGKWVYENVLAITETGKYCCSRKPTERAKYSVCVEIHKKSSTATTISGLINRGSHEDIPEATTEYSSIKSEPSHEEKTTVPPTTDTPLPRCIPVPKEDEEKEPSLEVITEFPNSSKDDRVSTIIAVGTVEFIVAIFELIGLFLLVLRTRKIFFSNRVQDIDEHLEHANSDSETLNLRQDS